MTVRSVLFAALVAAWLAPSSISSQGGDSLSLPQATYPGVARLLSDPAKALDALDAAVPAGGNAPIEALVLRAHLLSALRRYRDSVALWDEIARRDTDVSSFAGRSAIADLLEARSPDEAAPRIRAIVGPKPRREDDLLLIGLADAYLAAGQPDRAVDLYKDVLVRERQTAPGDRARLGLAAAHEAAGNLDAALTAFHQATIIWRLADTFATARTGERRLAARMHRTPAPLTASQYFAVADRLSAASHFDEAIALLQEASRGPQPASDKLEAAIIDNLYRGRQNDAAMTRAGVFLQRYPGSTLAPSIRLLQLRLDIRTGNLAEARRRLSSLVSDARAPTAVRQSAQRLVAANLAATGSPRDALDIYRALLKASMPRSDRYDVSWRAGIAAMRANEPRTALDLFRQARKYAPPRSTSRSTLYWMAAANERVGDAAEARRTWEDLAGDNASDYYGLRSAERLRAAGVALTPPPPAGFPFTQVTDAAAASPEFRTAMALARAGLSDDAASMFRTALSRFRFDGGLALLAARAATAAGDYATAWSIVATHFGEFLAHPASGLPDDVWQMAFPRAFWTEVEAAARKNAVDPLLLLSLMRRESRFVVSARSRTGAVGLFQIMPYTAREIMPAAEQPSDADAPLDAPTSADLAARLVKRIVTRFDGAPAPVVASYNAGEDRVGDWWRASNGIAEDLFVDSIPYGETRQYVREVLANYATYRRLYGTAPTRSP